MRRLAAGSRCAPIHGAFPMSIRRIPMAFVVLALSLGAPARAATAPKTPAGDLARLCKEYWEGYLVAHPTEATAIGDRRYDDRLENIRPAATAREQHRLEGVLARARAFEPSKLLSPDRVTR